MEKADPLYNTAERYYDDDQRVVLKTTVSSGGAESDARTFVFGNYIDEVILMRLPTGTEYLCRHDHVYSPVVLFGSTGTVMDGGSAG